MCSITRVARRLEDETDCSLILVTLQGSKKVRKKCTALPALRNQTMDGHGLRRLLDALWSHSITAEEAERQLRWQAPFEETGGFANVDLHRRVRCGFPEVIFGQGKTPEQVASIM